MRFPSRSSRPAVGLLAACGGGGYGGGGDSNPPATLSLSVEPTTITLGQSATLTWTTNGAACTAGGSWSGTKSAGGTETVTPTATGTFTYTLTCAGGGYGESRGRPRPRSWSTLRAPSPDAPGGRVCGQCGFNTDSSLVNPGGIAVGPDATVRVVGRQSNGVRWNGKGSRPPGNCDRTFREHGLHDDAPTGIVVNTDVGIPDHAGGKPEAAGFIIAGKSGRSGPCLAALASAEHSCPCTRPTTVRCTWACSGQRTGPRPPLRHRLPQQQDRRVRRGLPAAGTTGGPFRRSDAAGWLRALRNPGDRGRETGTADLVTYARRIPPITWRPPAPGQGLVSVFDTRGRFLRRLVSPGGMLNAPWGIAACARRFRLPRQHAARRQFRRWPDQCLRSGDGRFIGTVGDADGRRSRPAAMGDRLRQRQPRSARNTLFFAASTDDLGRRLSDVSILVRCS